MKDIKSLATQFRVAIDMARNMQDFSNDFAFCHFPRGCCGDTSHLLAQFLLEHGVSTFYVCGMRGQQSHAWLSTEGLIIVDITGDQFLNDSEFLNYGEPVYVGTGDNFHRLFKVDKDSIYKTHGLDAFNDMCQPRLCGLYNKIIRYLAYQNV